MIVCNSVVACFSCPSEMRVHAGAKVTVTEVEEGHEPKEFWSQLDSHDRVLYHSLLEGWLYCY